MILKNNYEGDFRRYESIYTLLGFYSKLHISGFNESENMVNISTINSILPYIFTYKSTARISRPPKFSPQPEEQMQDPHISRPSPLFRFYIEIYFVARNEASVRQFNRRSVSARSVLRSNQAATVCLRLSYRPITVSLFYRPYHWTAV